MHPWLPELAALAQMLPSQRVILDGEVVALVDGRPSIEALQQRMRTRRPTPGSVPVLLACFDLLLLGDTLLTHEPYRYRRAMLEDLELHGVTVQTVLSLAGQGDAMLAAIRQQDLEGVLAKRLDSPYRPGRRSRDWLKILNYRRLRVLVGGLVPAAGGLAALLIGEPDPDTGVLRFIGRVDHGFTPRSRRDLAQALAGLTADRSPFTGPVPTGARWGRPPGPRPRWVRPLLEIEVEHLGREPSSGRLRHPTFAGFPTGLPERS